MSTQSVHTRRYLVKRDGSHQEVRNDAIVERLDKLCWGLNKDFVDPTAIGAKVSASIRSGMCTAELDTIASQMCAYNATQHPDFSILAGRICISDLHKTTDSNFSANISKLYHYRHVKTGEHNPKVSKVFYDIVMKHSDEIQAMFDFDRDFQYDYFGFNTLKRSYLLKIDGVIVERPQHLLMRVAIWLHGEDLTRVKECYDLLSTLQFTHATPTLFNAGTDKAQGSSCFLLHMKDDSIEGIYGTLATCAYISKYAGGIGLSIHNVRATGSYIRGTQGHSNGIIPMLRVFNDSARYIDQGGGKRKGSIGIYIEVWHADLIPFLDLKKQLGKEEFRARDLFYALWIPDLFMRKVQADDEWCFFCPDEAPGLWDCWGEEFEALYTKYEAEGRFKKKISAVKLYYSIIDVQIETGVPYILFKDACNRFSNHQHLGTIKSSNLCTEIIEYTDDKEVAVCNLASIALNSFVMKDGTYDHAGLVRLVSVIVRNLDNMIDLNYYPVPEAERSNLRHRPMGIGVQGFANALIQMRMPFDSPEAAKWNVEVFESIYYGAMRASIDLAKERGVYETFTGSPASKGLFQFDMWMEAGHDVSFSGRYDWDMLRKEMVTHGLRNSLCIALMPTASTAQIMGNNEAFEPFTSNLYKRRVLAGEFPVINHQLIRDLCDRGLWTKKVRQQMIAYEGSIQMIEGIPDDLKALYKTVWEIKQKVIINLSAARAPFIDQSQSLNIHLHNPTVEQLAALHLYTWKKGLKTGMYYLRTRGSQATQKFTVDTNILDAVEKNHISSFAEEADTGGSVTSSPPPPIPSSTRGPRFVVDDDEEECLMCGS